MRIDENNPIELAAFNMVQQTYPRHLRESYELHMTAAYSAPPYVYVLQELAGILSAIGIGVLSNMVYERVKQQKDSGKDEINVLVKQYKEGINELHRCVREFNEETIRRFPHEIDQESLDEIQFHEEMKMKLLENDPEVIFEVEKALKQLKKSDKD
ncbi:hypothetical protein SE23_09285 [Vibrio sinaloensis]|uniref:hypothetical protein n=1 Tax=Photobacterium sp. (strain ATCC 43367) TaxID=379097 RepID=UPI00057D9E33|nr:hypothetical protein [Vibrio sinaloensis]KIE20905.1 hypothetical protein SE23_09285 [Vibrio sinaloensis]